MGFTRISVQNVLLMTAVSVPLMTRFLGITFKYFSTPFGCLHNACQQQKEGNLKASTLQEHRYNNSEADCIVPCITWVAISSEIYEFRSP